MRTPHPLAAALLLWLALVPLTSPAQEGNSGAEPALHFAARDISREYGLPALKDRATDRLRQEEGKTQVLARAERMHLGEESAIAAWMGAGALYASGISFADRERAVSPVVFTGEKASELNRLLADPAVQSVRVSAPVLQIDVPISVGRDDLDLDLDETRLIQATPVSFLLRVQGVENVRLRGGTLTGPGWGVLVSDSQHIAITGTTLRETTGGILVTNSRDITIRNSSFLALRQAAILLRGDTHRALVLNNNIRNGVGSSNWQAGIVLSDRNAPEAATPDGLLRNGRFDAPAQKITTRLTVPTGNLVAFNRIQGNASSGIYSDGASENVFAQNSIEGNSKEGFCLDNGSSANVVVSNVIAGNGRRWGKTDGDLQRDFVLQSGRLPDGSSPEKLPGLSIDNAAYNQVLFNDVHDNYGGGIKMVRTAFFNIVGMNTLNENNEGRSPAFHFFGMELGAAPADRPVTDLDFRPSRGNQVFGNTIRGRHYAGIFFAAGSDENMIFENVISGATDWAMESVERQQNTTFNNLSNLRCRNVGTGLDPALIRLGRGR